MDSSLAHHQKLDAKAAHACGGVPVPAALCWVVLLLLWGSCPCVLARPENYKSTFNKSWWVCKLHNYI